MKYRLNNVIEPLNVQEQPLAQISRVLSIPIHRIMNARIVSRAIDSRRKPDVRFVYSLEFEYEGDLILSGNLSVVTVEKAVRLRARKPLSVIIAGSGPAGLLAALTLARAGCDVTVIERGADVDSRAEDVGAFFNKRELDPESNIQYGEGGAGTFSDGKLNTGTKSKKIAQVLAEFVRHGAPEEILYDSRPHIGTDNLRVIVKNIRHELESLGATVLFRHKLIGFYGSDILTAVIEHEGKTQEMQCGALLCAIGHSAHDTRQMLYRAGIAMQPKPFAVGVRIEHSRQAIDKSQYGAAYSHPRLMAADYKLSAHIGNRGVFSFCMCPGGVVVNAASLPGTVVTNGMSYSRRDGANSNSAVLCGILPADIAGGVFKMAEFAAGLERAAFRPDKPYAAPVQLATDFIAGKATVKLRSVEPSIETGHYFCDINRLFPEYITAALKAGLTEFDKKINGFLDGAVLTGVETRSSSPVTVERDEICRTSHPLVFSAGEGGGHAGGITSSAVDGIHAAECIIRSLADGEEI